jgi:hypothetical protein
MMTLDNTKSHLYLIFCMCILPMNVTYRDVMSGIEGFIQKINQLAGTTVGYAVILCNTHLSIIP